MVITKTRVYKVASQKFRVWCDENQKCTFAQAEDGMVKEICAGYSVYGPFVREQIAVSFGLKTSNRNL